MTVTRSGTNEHPWCVKIDIRENARKNLLGNSVPNPGELIDRYIEIAESYCKNGSIQSTSHLTDEIVLCYFSIKNEADQLDQYINV